MAGVIFVVELALNHSFEDLEEALVLALRVAASLLYDVMNGLDGRITIEAGLLPDEKAGGRRRREHDLGKSVKTVALLVHLLGHRPGRIENDEDIGFRFFARDVSDVEGGFSGKQHQAAIVRIVEHTLKAGILVETIADDKERIA